MFDSETPLKPKNHHLLFGTMNFRIHAFAGNPIKLESPKPSSPVSPHSALQTLKTLLSVQNPEAIYPDFTVLPFRKGRPLAGSAADEPRWHIGWLGLGECKSLLENSGVILSDDKLVYLECKPDEDVVYWAIDMSEVNDIVSEMGSKQFCFVELRTLMVATDWADSTAMADLAIVGHVVIMLVIDKKNDCVLLSRQPRFVPRMWSCLAGFIEPGESLEEAVRRETKEEMGVEVGEVVYHCSQPWPVGPSSMPCQLMIGFFAYPKSHEINVDKNELEDAKWHSREDVQQALKSAEYTKAQETAAAKVEQMCKGVEQGQSFSLDYNVESGELAPMFVPGPFAIAHHLITSWANGGGTTHSSLSNL